MAIVYPNQHDNKEDEFIIGDVILNVPPESISTYKVENNEEINALRAKFPMITKTGQSLLNATVTWKAVLEYDIDNRGTLNYGGWDQVRRVMAMVKCAPFVQIENSHLRNVCNIDSSTRMIFALKQMTVSTVPDSTEVLQIILDLAFFNFYPYSKDFAYLNTDGTGGHHSDESGLFTAYLDQWMAENLDIQSQNVNTSSWRTQDNGNLSLNYRTYQMFNTIPNPVNPLIPLPYASYSGNYPGYDWQPDFVTTKSAFFYYDSSIEIGSNSGVDTVVEGISINFRNNFAQIPLANYQYPTYQHLGPAATMINIALRSDDIDGDGLGTIQQAINTLDGQYKQLKPFWKSANTIHAMQAMFVQNQILNMLGIGSVIPSAFNTSTDPDGQVVSGQLVLTQYENVFETLDPYKINDPSATSISTLQAFSTPANIAKLNMSPEQQAAIAPLTQFWAKEATGDLPYLYSILSKAPSDPNDYESYTSALGQLPQQPFSAAGSDLSPFKQIAAMNWSPFGTTVGNVFPGLATRVNAGNPTYADLVFMTGWYKENYTAGSVAVAGTSVLFTGNPQPLTFDADGWTTKLTAYGNASNPTLQTALYKAALPLLVAGNSTFATAAQTVMNSTQFKNLVSQGVQANGPGSDPGNAGHLTYADLGIKSLTLGGAEFSPTFYLENASQDVLKKVQDTFTSTLSDSTVTSASTYRIINGTSYVFTDAHLALTDTLKGTNCSDLFTRLNLTIQDPIQAFPTFKLFLMEDKAGLITYAYDDFYSYSAVQDIEVIKYQDKPDAALIRISNIGGLLNHKLYDNSMDGHKEYEEDVVSDTTPQVLYSQSGDSAIITPEGDSVKTKVHQRHGHIFESGNTKTSAPLKFYPLQTGSKIQVRLGYANNPDKLFPVFSGIVTELVEENEIITIEAQSFLLELTDIPDDYVKTDHWNLLAPFTSSDTFADNFEAQIVNADLWAAVKSFFSPTGGAGGDAPAYGQAIIGDDGTALGVISEMVKSPSAKHFGRWQINSPSGQDPYVRGFQWAQNPTQDGQSLIGAFNSLYDRSTENILTGNRINSIGQIVPSDGAALARDWNFENSSGGPSQYHIPKDTSFSPWEIMRDIRRRYPDNILTAKTYGFPWNCDATLVYANPYDFYRARPTSFSELGGTPANDATDKAAFTQWWNSGDGRAHFVNDFASKLADTQDAFLIGIGPYKLNPPAQVPDNTVANNSPSGVFQVNVIDNNLSYVGFINYLDAWARVLADNSGTLDRYIGDVTNDLTRLVSLRSAGSALSYTERLKHARDSLRLLKESANNFIQRSKTGTLTVSSTDIAQPVRRFHLADENDIIYNGIKLNGDICNTVTVGEKNYVASKFIPTHHRKVLDCNPLLVSKDNVATGALDNIRNGYAQTFLCEELGRMYVGDLVLRGKEGIEPHDVILINDPITGIKGPVKVKKVIHAFDAVSGFITIVTPECLILTNESATASILGLLDYAITNAKNNQKPILDNYLSILKNNPGTTTTVGVAAGIAIPAGIAGIAALGTIVSGTVLLPLAAAAGIFMAGYGLLTYLQDIRLLTPVIPMPLSRYGIVWAAGLEGYKSGNFTELFKDKYENFLNSEFYPLIESWRTLSGEVNLTINAVASSTATAGTQVATPRATSKKIGVMPDKTNTYLAKYAPIYGVPLNFARGIAWIESQGQQFNSDGSLNQTKIKKADGSPASSAIGVMQLVKGTAKQLGVDATKWEGNCEGGCKYLGQLVREFNGNLTLAAAAYYQGPGSVKKSGPNQAGAQYAANVLNAIS